MLLVGAEVHIGFMPWTRENFAYAIGESETPPTKEEWDWNSRFRHLVVLFGDAGAAVVLRATEDGERGVSTTSCTAPAATTRSSTCRAPASSTARTPTPSSSAAATTSP